MMVSLTESGETERRVSGSPADLESKDRGDNSLLVTRRLSEDMWDKALLDPRDRGKTGLFETQSPIGTPCSPSLPCLKAMSRCVMVKGLDCDNLFTVSGGR
jgi:hypothetical protein